MNINHVITNPSSTPFDNKHVRRLIDRYIRRLSDASDMKGPGLGIDPFARCSFTTSLDWFITNDLNPTMPTDYSMEMNDFCEMLLRESMEIKPRRYATLCLLDPPYTLRMLKDHYDGVGKDLDLWQTHNMWGRGKDAIASMMLVGGYCISFGYTTRGMGRHRGFEKKEILILESGGKPDRYDILVTVEQKVQHSLDIAIDPYFDFEEE